MENLFSWANLGICALVFGTVLIIALSLQMPKNFKDSQERKEALRKRMIEAELDRQIISKNIHEKRES